MEGWHKFPVNLTELSPKEKALFKKLIQAAKLIVPLYLCQKNNKYAGANFYPPDASRQEIEMAAKKDSAILSPYTFVKRDESGKLIAIPYHLKFKKELKPVAEVLEEAAELSDDKNFSQYLKSVSNSLLDGNYRKSEIIWLKTGSSKFGFVIGPIERYLDKLFFLKCAYQAWVGILDKESTEEAERFKNMILTSRKKILPGAQKVDASETRIRIDNTAIFSGLIADFMFTGTSLPNDLNLIEKYGSNLTIFGTSLNLKFRKNHFPIFEIIFEKKFQKSYSPAELYKASLRCILLHEIAHSLIHYRDAEKRLGNLFPVLNELYGYILGIKSCGLLLLKDALSQKELEAILIMHICRNFTWWLDSFKNPDVSDYTLGAAIAQNFFLRAEAIKEKDGIFWLDFTKLFICIDELSHLLEYHLALGNYDEAREFVEEYGSFDVFKKFSFKLKKIAGKI